MQCSNCVSAPAVLSAHSAVNNDRAVEMWLCDAQAMTPGERDAELLRESREYAATWRETSLDFNADTVGNAGVTRADLEEAGVPQDAIEANNWQQGWRAEGEEMREIETEWRLQRERDGPMPQPKREDMDYIGLPGRIDEPTGWKDMHDFVSDPDRYRSQDRWRQSEPAGWVYNGPKTGDNDKRILDDGEFRQRVLDDMPDLDEFDKVIGKHKKGEGSTEDGIEFLINAMDDLMMYDYNESDRYADQLNKKNRLFKMRRAGSNPGHTGVTWEQLHGRELRDGVDVSQYYETYEWSMPDKVRDPDSEKPWWMWRQLLFDDFKTFMQYEPTWEEWYYGLKDFERAEKIAELRAIQRESMQLHTRFREAYKRYQEDPAGFERGVEAMLAEQEADQEDSSTQTQAQPWLPAGTGSKEA